MSDTRMPAIFLGHGNPMHAIGHNTYTDAWSELGRQLPRPRAVLGISAHWYIPQLAVTAIPDPRTIHDFGGFPPELYEVQYPAPGDPQLAARVVELLQPNTAVPDTGWGLDHGIWAVLCHVYPQADVPIVQLSIDRRKPAEWHYELGSRLAPLRDEGVLIVGSGNVVHNLHAYAWGQEDAATFDWAARFDATVREWLLDGRHDALIDYESHGYDAQMSVPTPDHYLPLLYTAAVAGDGERSTFPVSGFDGGSISMLAVAFGLD